MRTFHTESSSRQSVRTVFITCIVLALLALLGLKISFAAFLFFEGIMVATGIFMLFATSRARWLLDFRNANLHLTNTGNHKEYHLQKLTMEDFRFTQSARQKAKNRGNLRIRQYPAFGFYDVEKFAELQQYLLSLSQEEEPDEEDE